MPTTSQPNFAQNWTGPIIGLVLGQRSFLETKPPAPTVAAPRPPWNPGPGATSARPLPTANIPANASPELREFLQNRATLNAKMDELRGQGATGSPNSQAFAHDLRQILASMEKKYRQNPDQYRPIEQHASLSETTTSFIVLFMVSVSFCYRFKNAKVARAN